MENEVKKFAEKIYEYKTQKTRTIKLKYLLNDFGIFRLTPQTKKRLEDLFEKYHLKINKAYSDEQIDWKTIHTEEVITVSYSEHSKSDFDERIYEIEKETTASQRIPVAKGSNNIRLFQHQIDALKNLTQFYQRGKSKKGILVLPTGGGKTLTAVRWLLQNVIKENRKVIWIAHRHELLEQARDTIRKNCYSEIVGVQRDMISVRLVSGFETHHQPRKITKDDDVIIASKDSLRIGREFLYENFLKHNKDIFMVIDEAHHAIAKTYTELINLIESHSASFNLLGLTATPLRTEEKEQTYLSKVFTNGIIFSTDLNKLIIEKILAKPVFEQIETGELIKKNEDFTEKDLNLINSTLDLPENLKVNIATRKNRNNLIVETYDRKKYGKTLVFALNKSHAIELDELFRNRNIKSKFIISGTLDSIGINDSASFNKSAIDEFRRNELDVLVNVNILTEGTDLPNANSVFLTRPTNSQILMTQMVGRVLRGTGAGGTETANIVSFIDKWDSLVTWVSPKELLTDETEIEYGDRQSEQAQLQIISIKLIQQFASLLDQTIDTSDLKALPAVQRIPVGWYSFQLEVPINDDESDSKYCKILVFENHFFAYKDMENEIESLHHLVDVDNNGILDEHEKSFLLNKIKTRFFESCHPIPSISDSDLSNFIEFYNNTKQIPPYFTFEQRELVNISRLVNDLESLNRMERKQYIENVWGESRNTSIWRELFNDNFEYFINEINIEENKRDFKFIKSEHISPIENEKEKLKDIRLYEWPEPYQQQLRDAVFEYSKDGSGNYVCAVTKYKSKNRRDFDIDHIEPFSKGKNNTVLANLRIVKSNVNRRMGNKAETYPFR